MLKTPADNLRFHAQNDRNKYMEIATKSFGKTIDNFKRME